MVLVLHRAPKKGMFVLLILLAIVLSCNAEYKRYYKRGRYSYNHYNTDDRYKGQREYNVRNSGDDTPGRYHGYRSRDYSRRQSSYDTKNYDTPMPRSTYYKGYRYNDYHTHNDWSRNSYDSKYKGKNKYSYGSYRGFNKYKPYDQDSVERYYSRYRNSNLPKSSLKRNESSTSRPWNSNWNKKHTWGRNYKESESGSDEQTETTTPSSGENNKYNHRKRHNGWSKRRYGSEEDQSHTEKYQRHGKWNSNASGENKINNFWWRNRGERVKEEQSSTESSNTGKVEENTNTKSAASHKSKVKMPSGKSYRISDPKISKSKSCKAELIEVTKDRKEFEVIEKEVTRLGVSKVLKVQKISNACLWNRYVYYRNSIKHDTGSTANETFLIPGFKHKSDVKEKGFDERTLEKRNGYPTGFYFYNKLKDSFPKGQGSLYFCRVALGNVFELYTGISMPHAPVKYNSVEWKRSYSAFIAFRGEQIYPEYLITYSNGKGDEKTKEEYDDYEYSYENS